MNGQVWYMFLILLFLKKRFFSMKLKRKQTFKYFVHCKFKQFNGGGGERTPWTFYLCNIKLQSFYTCINSYTIVVPKYFHFCFIISLMLPVQSIWLNQMKLPFLKSKWSDINNFIWFNLHFKKLHLYIFPLEKRKSHLQ